MNWGDTSVNCPWGTQWASGMFIPFLRYAIVCPLLRVEQQEKGPRSPRLGRVSHQGHQEPYCLLKGWDHPVWAAIGGMGVTLAGVTTSGSWGLGTGGCRPSHHLPTGSPEQSRRSAHTQTPCLIQVPTHPAGG